jgi:putative transposase
VDNGHEFTSEHFRVACEALEIQIMYAPPFTPEAKGFVERAIQTVEVMFFEEMTGYLGHNVAERKEIEARRSFAQRIGKKGEVVQCGHSPGEFQGMINSWVENVYHQRRHRGIGMSPEAKAAMSPRPARKIKDPRSLDILLTEVAERTIQKTGIDFEGRRYIASEFINHIGKRVKIRQDGVDISILYVFERTEKFICIARDKTVAGVTREEARELKKAQKAGLREQVRAVEVLENAKGDPMLELIQRKKTAPGQVRALPREEVFWNERVHQAARAVEEREKLAEEHEEEATQAAVGCDSPLAAFVKIAAQRQRELTEEPLRLVLPDPKPEEE